MTVKYSTGLRNHILDTGSVKAGIDGKVIEIYSGTVPADADAATGTATLLTTVSVNGDGTGITMEASATAGVLEKSSAESWFGTNAASGTASFFRIVGSTDDGSLSSTALRVQGTVAQSGGDAYLAQPDLIQGEQQAIDYLAIALPGA